MSRRLGMIVLLTLVLGCTRYGTNPSGGPFARQSPSSAQPAAPVPNNSPLALGTPVPPVTGAVEDTSIIPPRPPVVEQIGGELPTSIPSRGSYGIGPDGAAVPRPGTPPASLPPAAAPNSMPSAGKIVPAAAVVAPAPVPPAGPSREALAIAEVKKLAIAAAKKWETIHTYEAIVTRKELTPAKEMSGDMVLYQFRKEPMSVYIKNLGESGKGRELLYNSKTDKIHVVLGEGDHRLMPAGFKAPPVTPDDPRVKEKSRYSIREAGYGTPISKVAAWVAKAETGRIPADALMFLGPVERPEFPYPLVGVRLRLRPGDDAMLPSGGARTWFFDPKPESNGYCLPVLIIAAEPNGKEVEYYRFEKIKLNVHLTDADFSPDRLGKK